MALARVSCADQCGLVVSAALASDHPVFARLCSRSLFGFPDAYFVFCTGRFTRRTPSFAKSTVFWFFLTTFAIWALKANLSNWPGETVPDATDKPTPQERSTEQTALVRRILEAMDEGVWQVEGLTVGSLAQKVGAPEHQVRKAINRGLGHRNFASFINRARIDAAIKRLQAPEASEETILQIAFDVGFNSLGPFNRAFRETTGQSPTDFRKQALTQM